MRWLEACEVETAVFRQRRAGDFRARSDFEFEQAFRNAQRALALRTEADAAIDDVHAQLEAANAAADDALERDGVGDVAGVAVARARAELALAIARDARTRADVAYATAAEFEDLAWVHNARSYRCERRAIGQQDRFKRTLGCGSEWSSRAVCDGGHEGAARDLGCGSHRTCVSCRGRRARQMRARVEALMRLVADPGGALLALRRYARSLPSDWTIDDYPLGVPLRFMDLVGCAHAHARGRERWGLKFLTLPMPHDAHSNIEIGIEKLHDVHERFRRRVRKYLEIERDHEVAWAEVRAFEATMGRDERGHAHFHSLVWSPFVDHAILRVEFGRALEREGVAVLNYPVRWSCGACGAPPVRVGRTRHLSPVCACGAEAMECEIAAPALGQWDRGRARECGRVLVTQRGRNGRLLERVPWPVLDIRAVSARDGDVARELVKYMLKDMTIEKGEGDGEDRGRLADPRFVAGVYRALEQRRTITAPRGAWVACVIVGELIVGVPCQVEGCGCEVRYRLERRETGIEARGPPPDMSESIDALVRTLVANATPGAGSVFRELVGCPIEQVPWPELVGCAPRPHGWRD